MIPNGPASKLAKLLRPFGIKPQQIRTPDKVRGYEKAQFEDAWERYLDPRTVPDGKKDGTDGTPQVRPPETLFSEDPEKEQNKAPDHACTVVPSSNDIETGQGVLDTYEKDGIHHVIEEPIQ